MKPKAFLCALKKNASFFYFVREVVRTCEVCCEKSIIF